MTRAGIDPEIDDGLVRRLHRAALPSGGKVFRCAHPVFFGVADETLDALRRIGGKLKTMILRMDNVPYIDSTGAHVLETFIRQAQAGGTRVILSKRCMRAVNFLARLRPQFAGASRTSSLKDALGEDQFLLNMSAQGTGG